MIGIGHPVNSVKQRNINILHTEWSSGWGGQEIRVFHEASGLIRRGHRVKVVCQPGSGLAERCKREGVDTIELRIRAKLDPIAIFTLWRLMKREGIDVVNTHSSADSWVAGLAAKLSGVPVLVRTRHLSLPISTSIFNFIYRFPDVIITTAEAIKEQMVRANRFPPKRVVSIPTGVDLERFKPGDYSSEEKEALKDGLGIKGRVPIISSIAVLRSWKGHRYLLEAIPDIIKVFPKAVFLLVGEGPQGKDIEERVKRLGLGDYVVLTGHREDIPEILNTTDIFVLASTKYEGIPQVVLQAMAVRTPVVATDVGGIGEVVKDGVTGFLVEPCNPKALAEGILNILHEPGEARRLTEKGRQLVERGYGLETMVERVEGLYRGLLAKRQRR